MKKLKGTLLLALRDVMFSDFLQAEYDKRQEKNVRYSLRAFATLIAIDQSLLSKILKKEKAISRARKGKCLRTLGAEEKVVKRILGPAPRGEKMSALPDEIFGIVSDWRHFAILELFTLKDFEFSEKYIAGKLFMCESQVGGYLRRLLQADLLRKVRGKVVLNKPSNSWASHSRTSEARRIFQKDILQQSMKALESVPIDFRDHSSVTVAISRKNMPHFKSVLSDLRKKLMTTLQEGGDFDEVYQLSISFFPVVPGDE